MDCGGSMMQTNCPMTLGDWTGQSCPAGELICGVRTQLEGDQGSEDNTAINGIQFICCNNYPSSTTHFSPFFFTFQCFNAFFQNSSWRLGWMERMVNCQLWCWLWWKDERMWQSPSFQWWIFLWWKDNGKCCLQNKMQRQIQLNLHSFLFSETSNNVLFSGTGELQLKVVYNNQRNFLTFP